MTARSFVLLVGCSISAGTALAQTALPDDLAQNPDSFLVPPPEAVCNALAKVPNVDFAKLAGQGAPPIDADRLKEMSSGAKAAHLGVRAADAYVAVQAKDVAAFRRSQRRDPNSVPRVRVERTMFRKITTANKMADGARWSDLRLGWKPSAAMSCAS